MIFLKNTTYGLISGAFGVTGFGVMDGGQIFAITSMALGGAAMVSALIVRSQIKRMKLDTKVAIKMR